MWVDSLFQAIKEALGLAREQLDPETIRLNKIAELDKELEQERTKLNELLSSETVTPFALGVCVNRIVELRRKKDNLKK